MVGLTVRCGRTRSRRADGWRAYCQPILLADRGFAAPTFFRTLGALGWNEIVRSKGAVQVRLAGQGWQGLWTLRSHLRGC